MTINEQNLTASGSSERIQSLDIMRGIVLFGILLMNINGMGLAYYAYDDPSVDGGATGWDLYTWITTNMFFEGTMRGLFSLLFGVGMFIFLNRLERKGAGINAANIYFRRITWLLVFGLIHAYILLWAGEILYNYALMGFLVFSFRNLAPKKLIIICLLLTAAGTLWNYVDYKSDLKLSEDVALINAYKAQGMPVPQDLKAAEIKWDERQWNRSAEGVADGNVNMRKGYFHVMAYLAPYTTHENKTFPYRYDVWDVLSMMLLGIALYKLNILDGKKSMRFYGLMILIGYGIGLSINYYETKLIIGNNFSFLAFSQANVTYALGRLPVAIGHIGLILVFCKLPFLNWLKAGLAAVGKMALTNYVMHSIMALFVFTGAGLGLFGKLHRHELLYIVFATWTFQLIISPIWFKYFQFGPLEWLWRNLSYGKRHSFKIDHTKK